MCHAAAYLCDYERYVDTFHDSAWYLDNMMDARDRCRSIMATLSCISNEIAPIGLLYMGADVSTLPPNMVKAQIR
jgi:hypothetical protein